MSEAQLFLIDAHALCYRSYYALPELTTSRGQPTQAVYGFHKTLKKILREYKPDYMAVCFDVGKKTRRHEKYAEYKVQRPKMPDGLISQLPLIKRLVDAYRLPIFEVEGYEADDVIATIAGRIRNKGIGVVIVSDDKDMFQLVDERIKVFSIRKDKILSYTDIKTELGFEPAQIVDYIALAGDSSDNIPGVKGIGDVSAKSLIKTYGSLEEILAHVDALTPPRLQKYLSEQKDMAIFSRDLALLEMDSPISVELKDLKVDSPDSSKLFEILNELEFHKEAAEFASLASPQKPPAKLKELSRADVSSLVKEIKGARRFVFFPEICSTEETLFSGRLLVAVDEEVLAVDPDHVGELAPVFADEAVVKITHDLKERLKFLHSAGIEVKGKIFDCLLAGYLLVPARSQIEVNALAWQYLSLHVSADSPVEMVPALLKLYAPLKAALEEQNLLSLFEDIEVPLATVLYRMETEGVKLDETLLEKLSRESQKRIDGLMKDIFQMAGEEFNINSPKQLATVLFEKLKLPTAKKTKTGFSTNEEVLTMLASKHPLPATILEYRQLAKLKSTYIDALPRLVDPRTGRVHASFNQTGTETGRLSSNNPNLQNIPIRAELGREIRKAFIPSRKENVIIAADYSQIELRILAHLSQDETLIKAFQNGEDIHSFTASLIFDVEEKDVTYEMRDSAKRVNFGLSYGMSAFGLAKDLGVPQMQAQAFMEKYFLRYPKVKTFMDNAVKSCEEKGYVVTLLNRRRYIPDIASNNMAMRQFAQRQAINTPVQGSAADLIKLAMIRIQQALDEQKLSSKMIITVHDELVFDAVPKEEKELVGIIRRHMEKTLELLVPIEVTIKKGKNWLETEKIA